MRCKASAVLALALLACGPKEDDSADTQPPPDTDTSPPVQGELLTATPTVVAVDPARNPLTFLLHVETTVPTTLELTWNGRTRTFGEAAVHDVPLLGFHADSTTPVEVKVTSGEVEEVTSVDVVTPPLPAVFPRFEILVQHVDRMEPGYTVVATKPGDLVGPQVDLDYLIALDENAEVVWFQKPTEKMFEASVYPGTGTGGTVLTLAQPGATGLGGPIVEETILGEEIGRFQGADSSGTGIAVYDRGFHHEALRLPDGRMITLSKEPLYAPYPTDYVDPANSVIPGVPISADVVVEFDALGNPGRTWHLGDWLPTTRIGYSGLEPTHFDGLADWTHGNGVAWDESDDSILLSLRNQNAIVKMDANGDPVWILGTHEAWPPDLQPLLLQPDASVEWFYSQHAPTLSADGTRVMLFDNGETRGTPGDGVAIPPESERYSRVVEYEIDGSNVTQTWELKDAGTGALYSAVIGDADYLSNGNVLGCFGHVTYEDGQPMSTSGFGARSIRIIEADPGADDEIVFDLRVYSTNAELSGGWMSYRADRIPDLY